MLARINKAKQEIAQAILDEIENEYKIESYNINDFYNKITNAIKTKYLFESNYIKQQEPKTFLINIIHVSNKLWGVYYCKVYNKGLSQIKELANENYDDKSESFKIPFWSWTWKSRITEALRFKYWKDIILFDLSF